MSNALNLSSLNGGYVTLADAICARVSKSNIADWCNSLEKHFNLEPYALLPRKLTKEHIINVDSFGVVFIFSHPHALYDITGDVSRWFLHEVEFVLSGDNNVWTDTPPYSLDVINETQDTVIGKLSDDFTDVRESDFMQSFFLDDGKVVAVQWNRSKKGIQRIIVTHLGSESDYKCAVI
ncbi:hypothetical protein JJQ14_21630 [Enterobacter cloacae]|nr:hypothetical protein [Enterobacter cloacae]